MIAFELLFIPLVTVTTFVIAYISFSIVLEKRNASGFVSTQLNPSPIVYLSTANIGNHYDALQSWSNRTVYVSLDVDGSHSSTSIRLWDPPTVPQGTTVTFFNSPSSLVSSSLVINYDNINVCLGRGQGATFITMREIFIGIQYIKGAYQARLDFPEVQEILWRVYRNISPSPSILCSTFNQISAGTTSATNTYGCAEGFSAIPSDDPDLNAPACAAAQCICAGDPNPSKTVWCNNTA